MGGGGGGGGGPGGVGGGPPPPPPPCPPLFALAVERRRRDKINNWIVQLSKIIPDCNADNSKTGAVRIWGGGL